MSKLVAVIALSTFNGPQSATPSSSGPNRRSQLNSATI